MFQQGTGNYVLKFVDNLRRFVWREGGSSDSDTTSNPSMLILSVERNDQRSVHTKPLFLLRFESFGVVSNLKPKDVRTSVYVTSDMIATTNDSYGLLLFHKGLISISRNTHQGYFDGQNSRSTPDMTIESSSCML